MRQSEGTTTTQTAHIHCQGSTCTHDYLSPCAHRQQPVLLPKANPSTRNSILALPSLKDSILAILLSFLYVIKLPSLKTCCFLPLLCSKKEVSAFTPFFFSFFLLNPLQRIPTTHMHFSRVLMASQFVNPMLPSPLHYHLYITSVAFYTDYKLCMSGTFITWLPRHHDSSAFPSPLLVPTLLSDHLMVNIRAGYIRCIRHRDLLTRPSSKEVPSS